MERLVKPEDLLKYPQLKSMGVSANQHYDFTHLEANEQPPVAKKAPKTIELKKPEPEKEEKKVAADAKGKK